MNKNPFPCFSCGKCCQRVSSNPQGKYLDRGDGTCRHFDDSTKHCKIYNDRPLICRVEAYYKAYLTHIYSWQEYVEMNLSVCHQLNQEG